MCRFFLPFVIGFIFSRILMSGCAAAQCISTFPYNEDFEAGPSGWTSGGTNSDWTLGTPSKPRIGSAGSGINCWITGGLSAPAYNGGQKSWLMSPCFDFSALNAPFVEFLIYWDTERQYDGGNLQYSLNNGTTWTNVGFFNNPADCRINNWYNASNILNLSGIANPQQGWSGTSVQSSGSCLGGNGSGAWLKASYCLSDLAGQSQVQFRFTFCSGTTCNNYDGIAIDSFSVSEVIVPPADFTYFCKGVREVSFSSSGGECPTLWEWDFGDPSSGQNSGSGFAPAHTFSGPGNYKVTHSITEPCYGKLTVTRTVIIPGIDADVFPVTCVGQNNGAISVSASFLSNPQWLWDPPLNTAVDSVDNLAAGTYTVTVSGDSACSQSRSFSVGLGPDAFPDPGLEEKDRICPGEEQQLVPGNFESYAWSDGSTAPFLTINDTGIYWVLVTNSAGCTGADTIEISINCFTELWFPSAFSPNNDGKNETFGPVSGIPDSYRIKIINRYGQPVFESGDFTEGWDGTFRGSECPEGVYIYEAFYTYDSEKEIYRRGRVTLIR